MESVLHLGHSFMMPDSKNLQGFQSDSTEGNSQGPVRKPFIQANGQSWEMKAQRGKHLPRVTHKSMAERRVQGPENVSGPSEAASFAAFPPSSGPGPLFPLLKHLLSYQAPTHSRFGVFTE